MDTHASGLLAELTALEGAGGFLARHVALSQAGIAAVLHQVGASSLDDLAARIVPAATRDLRALNLPTAVDGIAAIAGLRAGRTFRPARQ